MAKDFVKTVGGKIIGSLETMPNGDVIARDFYNKILGKYDKANDCTRDFYGKILYRGNQVGMLIANNEMKR